MSRLSVQVLSDSDPREGPGVHSADPGGDAEQLPRDSWSAGSYRPFPALGQGKSKCS